VRSLQCSHGTTEGPDHGRRGAWYKLADVVEDRSMLRRGEKANVEIVVDRNKGTVEAPLGSRSVSLPIA
jgi:hypothetical protein